MSKPAYRIDAEGNLVEVGAVRSAAASDGNEEAGAQSEALRPEQVNFIVRALILSEALVVLILMGGAVYYADLRGILLAVAAAYAVVAVFATGFMRRSLEKRVPRGELG